MKHYGYRGAVTDVWHDREALRAQLQILHESVSSAKQKLSTLEEIRALIEERAGETVLYELFSALLEQTQGIRREADGLSEELCVLEDELSDAAFLSRRQEEENGDDL